MISKLETESHTKTVTEVRHWGDVKDSCLKCPAVKNDGQHVCVHTGIHPRQLCFRIEGRVRELVAMISIAS